MGRLAHLFKLGSKLVLQILPSITATVIGGYLLTQLHFNRTAEAPATSAVAVSAQEAPTVGEERAAIRDVLRARRENPEVPEMVRPKPKAATTASVPATAPLPPAMDSIAPNEPVARAAAPSRSGTAAATAAAARRDLELPRARPDAAASVYVPAPPPGLQPVAPAAVASAAPVGVAPVAAAPVAPVAAAPVAPMVVGAPGPLASAVPPVVAPAIPPAVASAPAEPAQIAPPPVNRGPVGTVLSGISVIVGQAANATGQTVNWVIDLPGRAIEAGGRVIGVTPPPPPPGRPFS